MTSLRYLAKKGSFGDEGSTSNCAIGIINMQKFNVLLSLAFLCYALFLVRGLFHLCLGRQFAHAVRRLHFPYTLDNY
jgi:hypothetical protein